MPSKNSKITARWEEASKELADLRDRTPENPRFSWDRETSDWEMSIPKDVESADSAGTDMMTAPTRNPKRPRAYTIAYNPNTKSVIIAMRSGVWWEYENISTSTWLGLKSSSSTNDYLPVLEQECSSHHEANIDALSVEAKERISYLSQIASRIQGGDDVLTKVLKGEENLRSFTAEELFREYQ